MTVLARLLIASLLFAVPSLANAERTLALVIGIDDYAFVPKLDGARNDALDIASALKRMGASRVVTLVDGDVSKESMTSAWQSLMADARRGDTVFLTYAGHGAQAPQKKIIDEADAKDEFWVLPGFDPKNIRGTWRQTMFDNEIHQWLTAASDRGIRVVLVSDSCHAGGMDRVVSGKLRLVPTVKERFLGELLALVGSAGPAPAEERPSLPPNITMLAATSEALPVPEVVINGKPRGALSWSVARAIEGFADSNGDRVISRRELEDYVFANVRMRSEALQVPVFTPTNTRSGDEKILTLAGESEVEVASAPAKQGRLQPLPMARDLGFAPVLPLRVTGTDKVLVDTMIAPNSYEWDAVKGTFKTPNGEVGASGVTVNTVDEIVSKFILVDFLKVMASRNPGKIVLAPEKQLHLSGERLKFKAEGGLYSNLLVFNLANTGEVQYIDMIINNEPSKKTFLREMKIVPPFGVDHLVTIQTNEPLESVGHIIEKGIGTRELLRLLTDRIDGTDSAVALMPIYTKG